MLSSVQLRWIREKVQTKQPPGFKGKAVSLFLKLAITSEINGVAQGNCLFGYTKTLLWTHHKPPRWGDVCSVLSEGKNVTGGTYQKLLLKTSPVHGLFHYIYMYI